MQVRLLSRDALWIEMPLSVQTCLLVWHAMTKCGLINGKINSYQDVHFGPLYDWQPHLIEGRTPSGFLAKDNARVQAQLSEEDGGTRLDFYAVHPKGGIDFGASTRFKRRLVPRLEQILRDAPLDWQQVPDTTPSKPIAPLPSPDDTGPVAVYTAPRFDTIVPLSSGHLSLKERLRLFGSCFGVIIAGIIIGQLQLWGLALLLLGLWEAWKLYKNRPKWDGLTILLCLFYLALGIYNLLPLVRHWL